MLLKKFSMHRYCFAMNDIWSVYVALNFLITCRADSEISDYLRRFMRKSLLAL